jgi:hypothetical protein
MIAGNYHEVAFDQAKEQGREAAKIGGKPEDNPYKKSGHERETTLSDELHQAWMKGFEGDE